MQTVVYNTPLYIAIYHLLLLSVVYSMYIIINYRITVIFIIIVFTHERHDPILGQINLISSSSYFYLINFNQ